jgi:hypothetical protein
MPHAEDKRYADLLFKRIVPEEIDENLSFHAELSPPSQLCGLLSHHSESLSEDILKIGFTRIHTLLPTPRTVTYPFHQ